MPVAFSAGCATVPPVPLLWQRAICPPGLPRPVAASQRSHLLRGAQMQICVSEIRQQKSRPALSEPMLQLSFHRGHPRPASTFPAPYCRHRIVNQLCCGSPFPSPSSPPSSEREQIKPVAWPPIPAQQHWLPMQVCKFRFSFTPRYAEDAPSRLPLSDLLSGLAAKTEVSARAAGRVRLRSVMPSDREAVQTLDKTDRGADQKYR